MSNLTTEIKSYFYSWKRVSLMLLLLTIGTVGIPFTILHYGIFTDATYNLTPNYWVTIKQEFVLYVTTVLFDIIVVISYLLHFIFWSSEKDNPEG